LAKRTYSGGDTDSMKTKELEIPDYGKIILKKLSYREKCDLRGKILKITINSVTKAEEHEVNSEALFFWLVVYSIKSMPNYPEFDKLDEKKKVDIVSHLGLGDNEPETLGEMIFQEAQEFNKFMAPAELKKK